MEKFAMQPNGARSDLKSAERPDVVFDYMPEKPDENYQIRRCRRRREGDFDLRNLMVTDDGWLSPMTGIFPIHFSVPIPSQSLSRAQHAPVNATNITWNLRYRVTYFNYAGSIGHTSNFPESSAKTTQIESGQTACRMSVTGDKSLTNEDH
ncbi:hypothetical protein DFH09DRAFT_1079228 [Mycena vulgaris]|nr:hypothetical protein DFH09DRAFT_1079228 [Mycena vulgaris]